MSQLATTDKDTDNDLVVMEDVISLKHFHPYLRKLGKHLLKSKEKLSLKEACEELNLNVGSIYSLIYQDKQKGNDFNAFIKEVFARNLELNKLAIQNSMILGAVSQSSTSHNDRKLFFELTGDRKEANTNININGTLAIGVNIIGLNQGDNDRDKGTIDITPTIPKGKD